MLKIYFLPVFLLVLFMSCSPGKNPDNKSVKEMKESNSLLTESSLDFHAPAFDKIKNSDYAPAFSEGIQIQLAEISKIADNKSEATFENTLVALEKSGRLLKRVSLVFGLLTSANTNPELQKLQEDIAPKLSAVNDAIYLNTNFYQRVEKIYLNRAQLNLDAESKRLVEYYYQQFQLAGAKLSDDGKEKMKKLNAEEASLSARFTNKLLAASKKSALTVSDQHELSGLGQSTIEAAAQKTGTDTSVHHWSIPLQNTTQQPALQSLISRTTRQKLFELSVTRAEKSDANDTRETIARIAQLRALKAELLGFKSYAAWKLQDQMVETPENVLNFLGRLIPAATAKATREAAEIQKLIDTQKGGFQLQPYDWNYYADQVRKAKYDLDESEIRPYFELNKVLQDGVFFAANQLYGLTFKERKDLPVYQSDVRVFDVIDRDGSKLGLFYCDYFKRDNKSGGAWMSNLVNQSKLLGNKPVIYNVCNFTKPAPGKPALISHSDVTTMFHEFGHGLHGLFANQQYETLSGSAVARDFVEFPSQFNEHWASDPKIFGRYAVHYQTGRPMPAALIEKMKKAATFNQGYALTEALAAASLDMQWHSIGVEKTLKNVDSFENQALEKTKVNLSQVPPRYRSSYFLHIWGNGYAAGYYAYSWTEMLDDDAFSWFKEHGGLSRANGDRFRTMILSKGNTENLATIFLNFRGHAPDIRPMLENRGLLEK